MEVKGMKEPDSVTAETRVRNLDVMVRDIIEVKRLQEQDLVAAGTAVSDSDMLHHSKLQMPSPPFPPETRPSSPVLSTDEMDDIIQRLSAVQSRLSAYTPEFFEKKRKNVQIYMVISCYTCY
jgi:hypothetical protein